MPTSKEMNRLGRKNVSNARSSSSWLRKTAISWTAGERSQSTSPKNSAAARSCQLSIDTQVCAHTRTSPAALLFGCGPTRLRTLPWQLGMVSGAHHPVRRALFEGAAPGVVRRHFVESVSGPDRKDGICQGGRRLQRPSRRIEGPSRRLRGVCGKGMLLAGSGTEAKYTASHACAPRVRPRASHADALLGSLIACVRGFNATGARAVSCEMPTALCSNGRLHDHAVVMLPLDITVVVGGAVLLILWDLPARKRQGLLHLAVARQCAHGCQGRVGTE